MRVDLEDLLGRHVLRHRAVTERLSGHDVGHTSGPTELSGDEDTRRFGDTVGKDDLLDLFAEDLLDGGNQVGKLGGLLLTRRLLLLGLLELETFFGDADELLALELLELRYGVLVDRVDKEKNLEALLLEDLNERRVLGGGEGFSGEVVDRLLDLGHAGDVVLERSLLLQRLGGVEAEELGELLAVGGVLMNTELDVLAKGLVEPGCRRGRCQRCNTLSPGKSAVQDSLVEAVLVLGNLGDHLQGLLDDVLADDLQDLVLLKSLTRDVERQVLRVDDTLDEVEVLWDEVLAVVHDEDTANVELDVVALLLGLEEVERCADEQKL